MSRVPIVRQREARRWPRRLLPPAFGCERSGGAASRLGLRILRPGRVAASTKACNGAPKRATCLGGGVPECMRARIELAAPNGGSDPLGSCRTHEPCKLHDAWARDRDAMVTMGLAHRVGRGPLPLRREAPRAPPGIPSSPGVSRERRRRTKSRSSSRATSEAPPSGFLDSRSTPASPPRAAPAVARPPWRSASRSRSTSSLRARMRSSIRVISASSAEGMCTSSSG